MKSRVLAVALLACTAGLAPAGRAQDAAAAAPAAAASAAAGEVAPRLAPLLGLVLGRVIDAAVEYSTGDTSLGLFRRLAGLMQNDAPAPAPGAPTPTASPPAGATSMLTVSAVSAVSAVAGAPAPASPDTLVPALAYAMELLDPSSFAVLRPVPVAGSGPLLRSGEVFVLQFSTSLPGRVRLENTDPAGRVSDLGTYTVLVDQLNRIPRDKGIQLQGQPGVEQLRFYFYPCLPAEAAGRPWAAEFAGRLPSCNGAPPLLTASAEAAAQPAGTISARALVNLAQPDATMAFAGSSDYQSGEVTLLETRIRHESRAGGR